MLQDSLSEPSAKPHSDVDSKPGVQCQRDTHLLLICSETSDNTQPAAAGISHSSTAAQADNTKDSNAKGTSTAQSRQGSGIWQETR